MIHQHTQHKPNEQSGFSLMELMVAVVIVGVLASIAIVAFSRQKAKARASEVPAMFAEFRTKQGAYQVERGTYLSTGADETDRWPPTPGSSEKVDINPLPATWTALRINSPMTAVYCSYVTIAGAANDATNIGPIAAGFGFVAPPTDWFYVLAECDLNGDPTVNSVYFIRSDTTNTFIQNEGF